MSDTPTVFLAGRMSAPWKGWLPERLESDWTMLCWTEEEGSARFAELLPQADAVVGGRLGAADWPAAPKLKLYQIPFTGYDWLTPADVPVGCTVCNAYEHEIAIAEYVFAALLDWEIGLSGASRRFRTHGWEGRTPGIGANHGEVYGKTLGIVGYGHIGRETAARAAAFGMRTIAVSRTARPAPAPRDWLKSMEALNELLAESDYVLLALPLNHETRGLIDADRLACMKDTGVLINVARGEVVDEEALYHALAEKRIGGAVIDVWYQYPTTEEPDRPPSRFPFQDLENLIMSPHNSARSGAARERRWGVVARNLDRLAKGEALENVCFSGERA
ncbi:MAG: 2-hydroxyacid dehydrogenase [Pseudomonadota bacterium]